MNGINRLTGDQLADVLREPPLYEQVVERREEVADTLRRSISEYLLYKYYEYLTGEEFTGNIEELPDLIFSRLGPDGQEEFDNQVEKIFLSVVSTMPAKPYKGMPKGEIPLSEAEPTMAEMGSSIYADFLRRSI